jgi:hypothetical protein
LRFAEGDQSSVIENRKAIADTTCAVNVMGDNNHGGSLSDLLVEQQIVDLRSGNAVESAAGLID